MVSNSQTKVYLWAMSAGGLVCGLPSMFFLFFHPLLILWGFVLGIGLGWVWLKSVYHFQEKQALTGGQFCLLGFGVGLFGALVWSLCAWYYLRDIWVLILIANAFLILTLAGIAGSLLGRRQLEKGVLTKTSDTVLAGVIGTQVVLFVFMPILKSLLMG